MYTCTILYTSAVSAECREQKVQVVNLLGENAEATVNAYFKTSHGRHKNLEARSGEESS